MKNARKAESRCRSKKLKIIGATFKRLSKFFDARSFPCIKTKPVLKTG
jgi:hypothetical protein